MHFTGIQHYGRGDHLTCGGTFVNNCSQTHETCRFVYTNIQVRMHQSWYKKVWNSMSLLKLFFFTRWFGITRILPRKICVRGDFRGRADALYVVWRGEITCTCSISVMCLYLCGILCLTTWNYHFDSSWIMLNARAGGWEKVYIWALSHCSFIGWYEIHGITWYSRINPSILICWHKTSSLAGVVLSPLPRHHGIFLFGWDHTRCHTLLGILMEQHKTLVVVVGLSLNWTRVVIIKFSRMVDRVLILGQRYWICGV